MPRSLLQPEQLSVFELARGFGHMAPSGQDILTTINDLQRVQGEALIIGGIALGHHGHSRVTHDIDILYATRDSKIIERLSAYFDVVLAAESGWHELKHRTTKVRLELIPEGALGNNGFLPFLDTVKGKDGFVSLAGLLWLKLAAGRGKDDVDVIELAKLRMKDVENSRNQLPPELHSRFDELLAKAKRELDDDPWRGASGMKRASIRDPRKPNP